MIYCILKGGNTTGRIWEFILINLCAKSKCEYEGSKVAKIIMPKNKSNG